MRSFLRFLMRNRLFSLINLAGLTLSLFCAEEDIPLGAGL